MFSALIPILLAATAAGDATAEMAPDRIVVPAGPFTMGRDNGPEDERPAHTIVLPAFLMDRLPVTNGEFARFLNATGIRAPDGHKRYDEEDADARIHQRNGHWLADAGFADHPAVEVSWIGARDFCRWRGARLPTEAEWEKAARGTDGRLYPWGNALPDPARARFGAAFNATAAVSAHAAGASPYGALDMAGNAWEWVSSAYRAYPFRNDDGRENPDPGPLRATRGGGHDSPADEITATQRGRLLSRNPRAGHHNIAFRCAADLR